MKTHFRHAYKITAVTALGFGAVAFLPGAASASSYDCDEQGDSTSYSNYHTSDYDYSHKDDYRYSGSHESYMNDDYDEDESHDEYAKSEDESSHSYNDDYEYDYEEYSDEKDHRKHDKKYMHKTDDRYHDDNGYGSGEHMNDDGNDEGYTNNDEEYRVELRSDLQEHVAVVGPALKAELLQTPDRDAAMDAVDMNTEAIADKVEEVYPETKDEFTELWGTHIGYYVDYTQAVRDGQEEQKETARQNLQDFATEASTWFAEQNDEYDQDHLREMIGAHGSQTLTIIDALAQEDYETAYTTTHEAYMHMGMLADYLTGYHTEE